ncbi:hypothetical protein C8R44DRAFT_824964 [Mycena epipterygia]|nr:hypothetical protein C8R44DRAFT_824964 [Mycena epipterygia]
MGHAGHVKELWQDMVALGLSDAPLCNALDSEWEVVLGALNLTVAHPEFSFSEFKLCSPSKVYSSPCAGIFIIDGHGPVEVNA